MSTINDFLIELTLMLIIFNNLTNFATFSLLLPTFLNDFAH